MLIAIISIAILTVVATEFRLQRAGGSWRLAATSGTGCNCTTWRGRRCCPAWAQVQQLNTAPHPNSPLRHIRRRAATGGAAPGRRPASHEASRSEECKGGCHMLRRDGAPVAD